MKRYFFLLFSLLLIFEKSEAQWNISKPPAAGYEDRISSFVDSLRIIDTHEHFLDPEMVKRAGFLDFSLFFLENGYNDLVSSGMPDTLFSSFFGSALNPKAKWKIIEPYWSRAYNTVSNRIILQAVSDLYGIESFDSSSVSILSERMKKNYGGIWFDNVMRERCKADYIIQDAGKIRQGSNYVHYACRFNPWLLVRRKRTIDSLAMNQTEPIFTLDAFVKSMRNALSRASNNGMAVIKINIAYNRTLKFEKTGAEAAKKVFKTLVNGDEQTELSEKDAKPLQDYMLYMLLEFASEKNIPVAFHTGLQSGKGNFIENSNPVLLENIFREFPEVSFVLFHGS
ncbi:MAG TPA: amidohydrolase family protein, partial [Bacteroidales bacterium]|nr:amidohydrolase family protein [Bacteroidales bacterium]